MQQSLPFTRAKEQDQSVGTIEESLAGKDIACIILKMLISNVHEKNLLQPYCGFHPGSSTTNIIFTVWQTQEKYLEQNMQIVSVFIDLMKVFDTVNRNPL